MKYNNLATRNCLKGMSWWPWRHVFRGL